jgi:DNA-binding GntR family transcriptional regulator
MPTRRKDTKTRAPGFDPFVAAQPRYLAVAQTLSQEIADGRHAVGAMLPTEHELAERFGVSRFTVREAIRRLNELGLVSRHQGVGTRVVAAQIAGRYVLSLAAIPDLWRFVEATTLKVLRKKLIKAAAAEIPLPPIEGDTWLAIEGLRIGSGPKGKPLSLTHIYVNGAFRAIADRVGAKSVPVFALVEEAYGHRVSRLHQAITAISATEKIARLLDVKRGSPALSIVREYTGPDETILEVSRAVTPAGRFTYAMDVHLEFPSQS